MEMTLMNLNTPVMRFEFDWRRKKVTQILDFPNPESAPLMIQTAVSRKDLSLEDTATKWLHLRKIPSWRKNLDSVLDGFDVSSTEELMGSFYFLSLSDPYWIRPADCDISWEEISYFRSGFDNEEELTFLPASGPYSSKTPDGTTDGMLPKSWIRKNGKTYLVKGGYSAYSQEPVNEWLVSEICRRLGFDCCEYECRIVSGQLVSVYENFLSEDEEFIPASQILFSAKKNSSVSDFKHYLSVLEMHGMNIEKARIALQQMALVDYLTENEDRHLGNFGIIRSAKTLQWLKPAPIFDTGQCMGAGTEPDRVSSGEACGKWFTNTSKKFSSYPIIFQTLSFDLNALEGLSQQYLQMMRKTQKATGIPDERAEALARTLEQRIRKLGRIRRQHG